MADGLSIDDFKKKVEALLTNLPIDIQRVNEGIALSIIPEITTRIRNKGVDGKGKKFGSYSTKPLPTFFFTHKGTGSGADAKLESLIKKEKKIEGKNYKGISYKEFREINNRPTDHVTLSFTDETLNDVGVINNRQDGPLIVTTIGALNTKTKAKYNAKGQKVGENTTEQILDFLGLRYGTDILSVNEEESNEMADIFDEELQLLINKYLE